VTPGRTPRVRGLVFALVAVLVLMGYAFWRATAGARPEASATRSEASDEAARAAGGSSAAGASPSPAALPPPAGAGGGGTNSGMAATAQAQRQGPSPAGKAAGVETKEAQLMARLRAIKDSDPAAAVTLAREGNRRFPDSAEAPERTSILIHALVAVDRGSEARGEAEQMVNHYPDSPWVREVERFTGAHRHRSVGVNDAGQVIFR